MIVVDCKFNCHKKCAALVPKDCQGYSGYVTADENSVINGDRTSQASSLDLNEFTSTPLPSEPDDRDSCLTEDDEPDTPVKPSLRYFFNKYFSFCILW